MTPVMGPPIGDADEDGPLSAARLSLVARKPRREAIRKLDEPRLKDKIRKKTRKRFKREGRTYTPLELEQEVDRRWAATKETEHEHMVEQLTKTRPSSVAVHRLEVVPLVELRAMRGLSQGQAIERALKGGEAFDRSWSTRRGNHKPADADFPVGMSWSETALSGTPNAMRSFHEFNRSNPVLHWATGFPMTSGSVGSYSGVMAGLHSAFRFTDPEVLRVANISAIRELASIIGDEANIGKYVTVDGMFVPAAREQRPTYSDEQEALVNHGLTIDMGNHGKRWCRGWSMTVLTDVRTSLPLVWGLRPAGDREYTGLLDLVGTLLQLWPECPITYISGDSEYGQQKSLSLALEASYGVHTAFYKRGKWAKNRDWRDTDGTPTCSGHGPMKLNQSFDYKNGLKGRVWRRENGFADGAPKDMQQAKHRWFCEHCTPTPRSGDWTYTYLRDDPRMYTWLPRQGGHWRVALRQALHHRRNSSETLNSCVQAYGLGLKGRATAFWVNSDDDAAWFASMVLCNQTLRRLAHASGVYQHHLNEALALNLLTPETEADYRRWKQERFIDDLDEGLAA